MASPKILVFGITGSLGLHFAEVAKEMGLTLHVFVRPGSIGDNEDKKKRVAGCVLHEGDVRDYASVLAAMQGMDAVVSLVGNSNFRDQVELVKAAKEAGVKRFIPSEFSCCLSDPLSTIMPLHADKMATRKALAESGIEWTTIQPNGFMQWFAPACFNMLGPEYPEKVHVFDGGDKLIGMSDLMDVARVTLRAVQDPRCANKCMIISFPGTKYTQNGMIDLWEKLSGTKVERIPMSAQEVQSEMERLYKDPATELEAIGMNVVEGYVVRGLADCRVREGEVRAEELYSDIPHTTLEEFYKGIIAKHNNNKQ